MTWSKYILCLFLCLVGSTIVPQTKVNATVKVEEEVKDPNDYTDIQKAIDNSLVSDESFRFSDYISKVLESKNAFSLGNFLGGIKDGIVSEVHENIGVFGKLIAIAIVAAIFTNFASVFMDNQVAETGFYIAYILMFTVILTSFHVASSLATETVGNVLEFVKVLIPTYFMSVTVSTGAATSVMFYEMILIMITVVNAVLIHVILPLIKVYLIILLADNLAKEDKLSKLAQTLGTAIKWTLRSLIVLVIGINAVQSMIAPVSDGLKRSIFVKMGSAIPGVGNLLSGVTETVLGASLLLKNAIGVAGLIAIIVICTIPLLKLVIYYFIYRMSESIVQPVSDKRILKCMGACSDAVSMLLQVVIVTAILFILSITIVTVSTTSIH